MPRGRPRKLKEENVLEKDDSIGLSRSNGSPEILTSDPVPRETIRTDRIIATRDGDKYVPVEEVDMGQFQGWKGYIDGKELPKPIIRVANGHRTLVKRGEPRYYFHGSELRQVFLSQNGKKTRIVKTFKRSKKIHNQIRAELRKIGIPGA